MTLKESATLLADAATIKSAAKAVASAKLRRIGLCGLAGSAKAMLLALMEPHIRRPALIIADNPDDAGYLYHDLCRLLDDKKVAIFPSGYKRNIRFGQADAPMQILRTEVLDAWTRGDIAYAVTCPEALAEKVPVADVLTQSTLTLRRGAKADLTATCRRLLELGFMKTDYVYEPGQFARRGSILDVYSYSHELPFRIDFFDDEIDSIRTFNVETQLSETRCEEANIVAAMSQSAAKEGVSLLHFVADTTPVFILSPGLPEARLREICGMEISESTLIANEGDAHAMDQTVDPDAFCSRLGSMKQIQLTSAPRPQLDFGAQAAVAFDCSPQSLYHKNFDLIADSFTRFLDQGYRILVLSDAPHQCDRLKAIFEDRGDEIIFTPIAGTLHEGFADNATKTCYFTDHQIFDRFHKYNLKSDRARGGKLALSLKELAQIEAGDYIVHIDHGIGRFGGLVKTTTNGRPQEMIKLIYQNDDIIMVSIHNLHKLSKYRGKEGVAPKINKLGSGAWNKVKERTKSKVKEIARDLIKLYAERRKQKGFAYSPDTYLQQELEASFIYEDTPDQLKATRAVKADMESDHPMDRLICGDVGFGKTEIAIRAAMKAAADGKQTAVLVPTTVLAMQHYRTFSERLKDLPVRVDFISRARKPKDVRQLIADLAEGKIDILIGTHKIIGKDVKFKALGLLVIDEEQKFGVAVKEKLKQMKVNVDTLTMSATPIPRTLQFSLMGARDLSSLNTPPANRQPIVTTVTGMSDDVIREAISFELSRNGQVFFIANRISQLDELEARIRRLVPGVRIVTGHGQMPPEKLEKAILGFGAGDYDVLLSTTIVENGIDMPNVNTIMVADAQNFGLSELHQLRGRVGRSSRKAFCYLLVPPGLPLSDVAHRRLQAIENFSDLGSGIHIAMQDLDIRGAGNLLGAEQSGFIADLGYETYQKILRESVIELKTEEFGDTFTDTHAAKDEEFTADCAIESDLELRLPPEYVPQESERIALYQELDNMTSPEQVETFRENLRDRFGKLPDVADELIKVVPLRILAKRLGIERLTLKGGAMYLHFVDPSNLAYYKSNAFGRVLSYVQINPKSCTLRTKNGRNSIVVAGIGKVSEALEVLTTICTLPSA